MRMLCTTSDVIASFVQTAIAQKTLYRVIQAVSQCHSPVIGGNVQHVPEHHFGETN